MNSPEPPNTGATPKRRGRSHPSPKKREVVFPKVPLDQNLVRDMVKNLPHTPELGVLGKKFASLRERIGRRWSSTMLRNLPPTVVVQTKRNVGHEVAIGYRVMSRKDLIRRPNWCREIFFSCSNIPLTLLRYGVKLLTRPWEMGNFSRCGDYPQYRDGRGTVCSGPSSPRSRPGKNRSPPDTTVINQWLAGVPLDKTSPMIGRRA